MHRTQIYFDETLFAAIKQQAAHMNLSVSAYIRETLKKDLEAKKAEKLSNDFSEFAGMWENRDITQEELREQAWK